MCFRSSSSFLLVSALLSSSLVVESSSYSHLKNRRAIPNVSLNLSFLYTSSFFFLNYQYISSLYLTLSLVFYSIYLVPCLFRWSLLSLILCAKPTSILALQYYHFCHRCILIGVIGH